MKAWLKWAILLGLVSILVLKIVSQCIRVIGSSRMDGTFEKKMLLDVSIVYDLFTFEHGAPPGSVDELFSKDPIFTDSKGKDALSTQLHFDFINHPEPIFWVDNSTVGIRVYLWPNETYSVIKLSEISGRIIPAADDRATSSTIQERNAD